MSNGFLFLIGAILFEVMGTTCMKLAEGFTQWLPSVFVFVFYGLCLVCLTLSLKTIEVSVAYAIWAGLGIALMSGIGVFLFGETITLQKWISILLIVIGVVGLQW